jgi:hypothetical protein
LALKVAQQGTAGDGRAAQPFLRRSPFGSSGERPRGSKGQCYRASLVGVPHRVIPAHNEVLMCKHIENIDEQPSPRSIVPHGPSASTEKKRSRFWSRSRIDWRGGK